MQQNIQNTNLVEYNAQMRLPLTIALHSNQPLLLNDIEYLVAICEMTKSFSLL